MSSGASDALKNWENVSFLSPRPSRPSSNLPSGVSLAHPHFPLLCYISGALGRTAQFVADENINCVLDGIGIVTAFRLQKAFLDERIDFCFV
jgi:hypothetical protein